MASGLSNELMAPQRLDAGYLESLFQSAGFAIVACEPSGTVVACNAAAVRLFGHAACASGIRCASLFQERDRERVEQILETCLSALEPVEFQTRLGGSDADPVEYAVWFTPVLEPDGALRGVSLWFRDITQRQRLQRMFDKRERLASLGSLSGAVAHHYNNLLCCIATSVEYAINMNTMTAMRRALQRTADAVARAAQITRQLLAFAQADHQSSDMADLTETFLYYIDESEARLSARHIKLFCDWQLVPISPVRREHLMLILGNLVDNAIEAMSGGGMLSITLSRRDEESVCISVADTGPGISAKDMEHLFEPFYTTKGELGEGCSHNAGMGLAVVHGLVAEMGGTITASNIPGRGARFDVVLPVGGAAHS